MSLDARIIDICHMDDGTAHLHLYQPNRSRIAGQQILIVINPDVGLPALGSEIWGGATEVMMGQTQIAKRLTYTTIEMIPGALAREKIRRETND